MQTDTLRNYSLTNQLLELQTVIDNPCEAYYKKRPAPRKRTIKQKENNERLPPTTPFDDGFTQVAEGIDAVEKWIQNQAWFQMLKAKLKQEDFDNFIGQTFQHKLAHRYLRKTDRKFRLKVHKHNPYCLKLENMKNKYTSATYRSPILNFRPLFAHLFPKNVIGLHPEDPQVTWWEQKETEYKKQETDNSTDDNHSNTNNNSNCEDDNHQNAMLIPTKKSWKNIDWSLWDSELIRVQYFGTCNAGQQMVNPCAHVAAFFKLIWWSLTKQLQEQLKVRKKDAVLLNKGTGPTNLHHCVEYLKSVKKHYKENNIRLYCICQKPAQGMQNVHKKTILFTIYI